MKVRNSREALDQLVDLVASEDCRCDSPLTRRLMLRAVSDMKDEARAAELIDRFNSAMAMIELGDIVGGHKVNPDASTYRAQALAVLREIRGPLH